MSLQTLIDQAENITSADDIAGIKASITASGEWLESAFDNTPVDELVTGRAKFIDALLARIWQLMGLDTVSGLALCAVGGYGRGHLQPHSDIDLLIVSHKSLKQHKKK